MVESIAATSLLVHVPVCGRRSSIKELSNKRRRPVYICRFPCKEFLGRSIIAPLSLTRSRLGDAKRVVSPVKAFAMEVTKEHSYREDERNKNPQNSDYYQVDPSHDRKPGFWPPQNKADNPAIHNPLLRQEMMGCGWLGAIFEWEGVMVEDNPDLERQAWMAISDEEGKSPPPAFMLKRIDGMKNEQAISEVLCWSRDPSQVRKIAARKEEIHHALQGGAYSLRNGSQEFVNKLMHYKIPMALVSTRPRQALESAIGSTGIEGCFSAVVAAEDVQRGKPDPEMFIYAAQLLKFIPERCIVFGNSNQTVEAAHDARMKCVAVASKHPVYELAAADLVVRDLNELSVVDLKNLADIDSEFGSPEPEMEMEEEEEEEEDRHSGTSVADDFFW